MPEVANDTLNVTLAAARDLKTYGGDATSFSPLLLSFAAIVCQHLKGGVFQTLPDWNSVVENDSCIKSHPWFHKTVGYGPLPAIEELAMPEVQAAESSLNLPDNLPLPPPHKTPIDAAASYKVHSPPLTPTMELNMLQPLKPHTFSDPDTTPSIVQYNYFVQGNCSNLTMGGPARKKRKAADDDDDDLADKPMPPSRACQPMGKKIKQVLSTDVQDMPSRVAHVVPNLSDKEVGLEPPDALDEDAHGFWDADTRLSVRHHPKKCDKCTNLGVPCIVLLDKSIENFRLACRNCDGMKVACAIDGVGIRMRMLAKAKANDIARAKAEAKAKAKEKAKAKAAARATNVQKRSQSHASQVPRIGGSPMNTLSIPSIPSTLPAPSQIQEVIVEHDDVVYQPTDVVVVAADSASPAMDVEAQITVPLLTKVAQVQDKAPLPTMVAGI
ncbi:hypothetical protein BDR05DRAFT_949561 [Suillus weaverae]|nr:hypothetical protein BDR05DRAFT_949561 [Suillus weaverae]